MKRGDFSDKGLQTRLIHAGEGPDPATRASSPNLVMSSTYLADHDAVFSIKGRNEDSPFFYTRWSNPTVDQLERKLMILEGAEACLCFASGMAAVSALFLHALNPGDRLVISDVSYAGTAELMESLMPKLGVEVVRVDMSNLAAVAQALEKPARLVYAETPCNPIVRLTDIAAVAGLAHDAGAQMAVDSTFATPVATQPMALGADYVIHSLTKYIGGHGDAMGGALLGPADDMAEVRSEILVKVGGCLSPFNAWLILRGAATLGLRMAAHQAGAMRVARFLENHPKVKRVNYPGLESHPQFGLAARQMACYSGMLAFEVDNGKALAKVMAEQMEVWHYAVSLGHHRSLIFHLPTEDMLSNSFLIPESGRESYRKWAGKGIFRTSVGLEDPADLIAELDRCLDAV